MTNNKSTAEIEARLMEFDVAWQKGDVPDIKEFLQYVDDTEHRQLLIELIKIDLECRWNGKVDQIETDDSPIPQRPLLEDYLREYHQLGSIAELPQDLIAEEYLVRQRWGDQPAAELYVKRFGLDPAYWMTQIQQMDKLLQEERTNKRSSSLSATRSLQKGETRTSDEKSRPASPSPKEQIYTASLGGHSVETSINRSTPGRATPLEYQKRLVDSKS